MMAASRIPADTDPALEQEIADLWADGFDTVDIAAALSAAGHLNERGEPITEADVYRLLWRPQVRRALGNTAIMEASDAHGA